MSEATKIAGVVLESALFRFRVLKKLGDGAIAQLEDDGLIQTFGHDQNSIAVIMQHLHGNMMSRWTDFLTSDGEKETRRRDAEFEFDASIGRVERERRWNEGWDCLFAAVESVPPGDITQEVKIRGQGLTAIDAINRQLTHVGYHIGQIVTLARQIKGEDWQTLSVARGASKAYKPVGRD